MILLVIGFVYWAVGMIPFQVTGTVIHIYNRQLRLKNGVQTDGLQDRITRILPAIDDLFKAFGSTGVVITSGVRPNDTGSQHQLGLAVDIRTKSSLDGGLPDNVKPGLEQAVRQVIPNAGDYFILLENIGGNKEHLHVAVARS